MVITRELINGRQWFTLDGESKRLARCGVGEIFRDNFKKLPITIKSLHGRK